MNQKQKRCSILNISYHLNFQIEAIRFENTAHLPGISSILFIDLFYISGFDNVLSVLIKNGANIELENGEDKTALRIAAEKSKV